VHQRQGAKVPTTPSRQLSAIQSASLNRCQLSTESESVRLSAARHPNFVHAHFSTSTLLVVAFHGGDAPVDLCATGAAGGLAYGES